MKFRHYLVLFFIFSLLISTLAAFKLFGGNDASAEDQPIFTVRRQDLVIDVLESGTIEAGESLVIRSEIQGETKILFIVPEGTYITKEDVENKKVLVRLASASLEDSQGQQEINCQTALAAYTNDKEQLEIQKKLVESSQKQAELNVRFGLMDLQKYVGEKLAGKLIAGEMDVADLIKNPDVGGEMLQKIRELQAEIDLAREEEKRASVKLEWTRQLEEKGYVSRDDLEADKLGLKQREVKLQQALTNMELFERYEYVKQAAQLLADYQEKVLERERTESKNRSELARAEVNAESSKKKYDRHMQQLEKINQQLEKCVIYATQPGLVAYANDSSRRRGNTEMIAEGTVVYERQEIINIPNTARMVVKSKVHESMISRVAVGQPVNITVDALPDKAFRGEVSKVAVLPDSQRSWLNPDLKVYDTEITILDKINVKPGLSAHVQIITKEIENVLIVPVNAVASREDKQFCFVLNGAGEQLQRVIETGEYNDKFIEVRSGLQEGERLVLNNPLTLYGVPQPRHEIKPREGGGEQAPAGEQRKRERKKEEPTQVGRAQQPQEDDS